MTDYIILTVPEDISDRARLIAEAKNQSVEQVLLDSLKVSLAITVSLPPNIQDELDALRYLSDDALWTIARAQMSDDVQIRADTLLDKSARNSLSDVEQAELDLLVERADRLMLRKAEAGMLLRQRGYSFDPSDYRPLND